MIDRSNLNRIKGVLSARKGAEIPKYQVGAKFTKVKEGKYIYSNDGLTWYLDKNLKTPHWGPIDGYQDLDIAGIKPPYRIPGDPEITPTTATENSAEVNKQVEEQKEQTIVEAQAANVRPPIQPIPEVKTNINTPPVTTNKQADGVIKSAGMQLIEDNKNNLEKKEKLANTVGQVTTEAFNAIGEAVGAKQMATDSTLTKGADMAYDTAAGIVENLGPVGKIVGTAMKVAGTAGDIMQELGGGTDQMTNTDKWMDSSFFSWNIGMLNGFAGKRSDTFAADQDILASIGSSYGGTTDDILDAASKSGKKYGLFSSGARKKANKAMLTASSKQNIMGDIVDAADDDRLLVQSMGEQQGLAHSLSINGGYSQKYTYAAKHGGMLEWNPTETLEWEPQVKLNWDLPAFKEGGNIEFNEELEWIPEFKEGGKTKDLNILEIEETTQKNVIPEGALHKNKHHMEHAEGLTKKGIPVIDEEGEQQAEIEHSEIIFTLEVTKKLEEYYEIFYSEESSNKEKDQAAIEAGKLLVFQILENTEDRTGLIESCKEGGSLTLKKSTDDLIEEVLEWMPTVVVIEEEIKEEPKKKSEKDQMKEAIKEVLIELLTK